MRRPACAITIGLLVTTGLLAPAAAWAVYKVVGPDGRVTYTDREPAAPAAGRVQSLRPGVGSAPVVWPQVLREPVQRFPVTLYTMEGCGTVCEQALALLRARGVPFQEKRASSDDERNAWIGMLGTADAPVLTVGQQRIPRFAPEQWNDTLDLAGYPRQSALPRNYQAPEVQPLLPRPSAETQTRRAPAAPPALPPVVADEPGRIRF